MLSGIHLLIGKINGRTLDILFFLRKYYGIIKVEAKHLKKEKSDVKFFFKIPNEIITCNNHLFQLSVRDLETKISWSLVILQPSFLTGLFVEWSVELGSWIMASFLQKGNENNLKPVWVPVMRTLSGVFQLEVTLPFKMWMDTFRRQFWINSFLFPSPFSDQNYCFI